jgi:hypothetical protein
MLRSKLNVEDINIIGIWEQPAVFVFHQHVSEDAIVVIPYGGMKVLSAYAIGAVIGIDRIGIQIGVAASTVIGRICKEFLAGH